MEAGYRNAVEFGRLIGKTDRMIRRYESGDTVPGVAVLQRWAELTGKTVEYFLEQPAATQSQVTAPKITHPGVEELAKPENASMREALGIEDWMIEIARGWLLDDGRGQSLMPDVKAAVKMLQVTIPELQKAVAKRP